VVAAAADRTDRSRPAGRRGRSRPAVALALAASLAGAAPAPGCAALREAEWGDVGVAALCVATLGLVLLLDDDACFWDDDGGSRCDRRPRRCR
jgi:hypothetical protein